MKKNKSKNLIKNTTILSFGNLCTKGLMFIMTRGKSREEIKEEERSKWEDMSVPEHVEFYLKQGMEKKEAMKQVAKDRGVSKREIYGVLLQES